MQRFRDAEARAKLPKWAQAEMNDLERMVRDRDAALEQLSNQHEGTNTFLHGYRQLPVQLPRDSRIFFQLGNDGVAARIRRDYLEIMGTGPGFSSLLAQPQSSNVLRIKVGDWF